MNDLDSGGVWPLCAATSLEMNMQILWGEAGIAGVGPTEFQTTPLCSLGEAERPQL